MVGMEEMLNAFHPRERQNSNPLYFTSGHEVAQRRHNGTNAYNNSFMLPDKEPSRTSPKPAKRTRKPSLFSFHFNSKSDEKSRVRRSSQPAYNYISPPILPQGFDVDHLSSESVSSLDSSPSSSRKCSHVSGIVEKENTIIHDIIQETLKFQFENITEYKREVCDRLGKNVCQLVKRRVEGMKEANGQLCKIVSVVYVGAVRDHGIQVASQALLEAEKDNFTAASYRNGHVFAVGGIMVVAFDK